MEDEYTSSSIEVRGLLAGLDIADEHDCDIDRGLPMSGLPFSTSSRYHISIHPNTKSRLSVDVEVDELCCHEETH